MIVTVANHKGGVGKTTTVVTLAHVAELRDPGTVAVLDLDAPTAGRPAGASQALRRARAVGLAAFTADTLPAGTVAPLLVVDTPPDLAAPSTREALRVADVVLVPTGVAADELEVAVATVEEIATIKGAPRPLVVLTRVPHYAQRRADEAAAELGAELEESADVATTRIAAGAAYGAAAEAGTTVASGRFTAWRRAARDYAELLEEIERMRAHEGEWQRWIS